MRHYVYVGLLIASTTILVHSETLSYGLMTRAERIIAEKQARANDPKRIYLLIPDYDNCSLNFSEEKRREIITKHGLPTDLHWETGYIFNEWNDVKESFCFLKNGNNYYLSFWPEDFWRFWKKSIPDRIVQAK